MKALKHLLAILLVLCIIPDATAQQGNKLVMGRNRLTVLIDLRSTKADIDSLLKAAGLTGLNADMVLRGNYAPALKNGWKVKTKKDVVQFDRSLADLKDNPPKVPYLISSNIKNNSRPGYPGDVMYGVNNFSRVSVHELPNGFTRFFVPGNTQAKRVLLSGSFNSWSTLKGIMTKTDSGWVADLKLEPGKYAYKFIVNGNWTVDVNNMLVENDGLGDDNSIYYRYNYTFRLPGYANAKRVSVACNFNKFNTSEIILHYKNNGWETQLYLHDGIYLYRFLVDGSWVTDPVNQSTQLQDNKPTSVLLLGETVTFKLNGYTTARKVYVAGGFNNWDTDMLPLKKTPAGWILPYTIAAGNYQYKYIVDGQYITDPQNPHQITTNGKTNSFIAVRANHTFTLRGYPNARTVRLAGDFNNWNEQGYTMEHKGDEWVISMRLKPGKYLYKYIVDGEWITDPGNKQWEQNQYDTGNSVLWID